MWIKEDLELTGPQVLECLINSQSTFVLSFHLIYILTVGKRPLAFKISDLLSLFCAGSSKVLLVNSDAEFSNALSKEKGSFQCVFSLAEKELALQLYLKREGY